MIINDELKEATWAYFAGLPRRERPHGLTDRRLEQAKSLLWNEGFFWTDIILRHGLDRDTIKGLQTKEPAGYDHLVGNFWGQMIGALIKEGKLK